VTPELHRVMVAPWTLRRGLAGLDRDHQDRVDMRAAWAWWTTYQELARRGALDDGVLTQLYQEWSAAITRKLLDARLRASNEGYC
jgi:hypothetical protein